MRTNFTAKSPTCSTCGSECWDSGRTLGPRLLCVDCWAGLQNPPAPHNPTPAHAQAIAQWLRPVNEAKARTGGGSSHV